MEFIHDEDIPYEQEIVARPDDFTPWWKYIQFKHSKGVNEQSFVLERALRRLKRSYKIWKYYLDLRVLDAKSLNDKKLVLNVYERALIHLAAMPRLWIDYLQFRVKNFISDITDNRRAFNRALQSLPTSQHEKIWPIYLQYAESINPLTRAMIWKRYTEFKPGAKEICVDHLIDAELYDDAIKMIIELLNDPRFESVKRKSIYNVWEDLIELVVHHSASNQYEYSPEKIILSALKRFPDQQGKIWVQLATYWINCGMFERARNVFEDGVCNAMTIRDFTQVFDSYIEFEETLISKLMENQNQFTADLNRHLEIFEQLMDRRLFLINDINLRQNPHNVHEWLKRVGLWGENAQNVVLTYNKAINVINPSKAHGELNKLWTQFARFYEKRNDLTTARTILDKATKVPYRSVNELAEIWIEWAEMELRHDNFDQATKIMETATKGPKISKVDFFDNTKSPQERLHKSMKIWSFYVDLVESTGTLDEVKPIYDRIFELKIGTIMTFVNYAHFLEENHYFEEAFKVYERGIELFNHSGVFELWNIYLQRAVDRQLGIERLRDLFEQALESCPIDMSKPIYIMYGKLEEDRGLMKNAIKIYDRGAHELHAKDKLDMYRFYISRVADNFGLPATRQVFQQAIDNLDDKSANEMAQEFINVEEKLEEIDRARALYGFASQFNNPELPISDEFWQKWHNFEVQNGNEDTYREMLRIKRSVKAVFENNVQHMALKEAAQLTGQSAIGFVPAKETSDQSQEPIEENVTNPDEIEI